VTLFRAAGASLRPYERLVPCWKRGDSRTLGLLRWLPRRLIWRLGLGSSYGVEQTTFALGLLRHLRQERIDVLHLNDPQAALLVQRAQQFGLVRTRPILGHGTEEPFSFLRKIKYLHHLSPAHLEEARAAGAWKPTWRMIPYFVDTESFRPGKSPELRRELEIPPDALVVLTAAAIKCEHKRIDYLLHEFCRLRHMDPELPVWLVIAGGRGPGTDELVEHGSRVLGNRVRFLVNYPLEGMPSLYRMADLFVLCSLKEMFGAVLLEATASALPCIVHRHPSMEWVIGPGGEAINMAQRGALATALQKFLHTPERCREAGRCARIHCAETFARDHVVNEYLDYYKFVLTHDRCARLGQRCRVAEGVHVRS
jgi:glycosyltransferase involved in cell wall biosynthesis